MVAELWTAGTAARVTELQLGLEKRGCMLLIPKERFVGGTPPPVFWEKRLQAVEKKGQEL